MVGHVSHPPKPCTARLECSTLCQPVARPVVHPSSTAKAAFTRLQFADHAAPAPPSPVCSEPAPGTQDLKYQDLEVVSHWVQTRELLVRNFRWVCARLTLCRD